MKHPTEIEVSVFKRHMAVFLCLEANVYVEIKFCILGVLFVKRVNLYKSKTSSTFHTHMAPITRTG